MSRVMMRQSLSFRDAMAFQSRPAHVHYSPEIFAQETFATSRARRKQRHFAGFFCAIFALTTILFLPFAAQTMPAIPGFFAVNQTALILVYGFTTILFFAHYQSNRSVSLLILAAGSLYTTLAVLAQLVCYPNMIVPGLIAGQGSTTLAWLWNVWHLGPPLFALPYAVMERQGRNVTTEPKMVGTATWSTVVAVCVASGLTILVTTRYVDYLPVVIAGDSYQSLNTSGIGPFLTGLAVVALAVLYWTTRLRDILHLWLAVSLFLLILDNVITDVAAARGTIGWYVGRCEGLIAALVLLGVYLREISRLWDLAILKTNAAQQNLEIALDATGMAGFALDLATDTSQRTLRHDQLFGYAELQSTWGWARTMEHVQPDDKAAVEEAFQAALIGGRLEIECRIQHVGYQTVRWIAIHGRTTFDDAGRPRTISGCLMDVTERTAAHARLQTLQTELSQFSRLHVAGAMASALAHELNQPLTAATSAVQAARRLLATAAIVNPPEALGRAMDLAADQAMRAGQIIHRLREFVTRGGEADKRLETVQTLVEEAGALALVGIKDTGIHVTFGIAPDLPLVMADRVQIQQVLVNLIRNAIQAMTDDDATDKHDVTRPRELTVAACHKGGDMVEITVADTGSGLSPEVIDRLFEPFTTTKLDGMGVGLSISRPIIEAHGGQLWAEPNPGGGAIFRFTLEAALNDGMQPGDATV